MTIASIPSVFYEFSFNADPNQNAIPPYWSDLSSRVQYGWTLSRGRQYELDTNEAGVWQVELANTDGALDPGNAASPYAPNVLPYRPCRIRVVLGNNLLTPDQASGGEYAPLNAGPVPAWLRVLPGAGNALVIGSVGAQAYQGTQVFVSTVPSGAGAPSDLLDVSVLQVSAGGTYTFSAQVQAVTTGQNPATYLAINWIGTSGATLSTASGSPSTLTGGSGTWTQLTVTGAAPAGTVAATLRVVTTTTPSANSTIWTDGLQLEARGYVTRWQMPWTPGVNLLPQNVATGTETMAATDSASSWFYASGSTTVSQGKFLAAAPSGQSTAAAWTIPSGTYALAPSLWCGSNTANPTGPVGDCVQVTAGQQYTASVYLSRAGTDPTVTVSAQISWFDSHGNPLSTSSGSAATVPTSGWVRATVTGTAPAGAAWGRPSIVLGTLTLSGNETVYATGWQLEQAAAATVWADPGPPCFLFTGLVERFPRTWSDLGATYGTSKLKCVDATAALSQFPLSAPFVNEVLTLGPNFLYQLNELAGSIACADSAGRRAPAPVENSPYGVGSLTFGSSITSNAAGSGFVGTSGPVATFNNPNVNNQNPATFVSLHKVARGGPPVNGNWTRIIHVRVPTGGFGNTAWQATAGISVNASTVFFNAGPQVKMWVQAANTATISAYTQPGGGIADGNWHQLAITCSSAGAVFFYIDGVQFAPNGGTSASVTLPFQSPMTDTIGSMVDTVSSSYENGWVGDLCCAVELPFAATAAQMTNLYNSWRTASSGESSGARYARVLSWIGWTGPTSIASGSTQSMGPATDTTGQTPLSALNLIAATENGDSYVSAAGVLTFTARSALYGARTPAVTFGENLPVGNAGEWPVEIGSMDFDPAHLANVTQVTQYQGSLYTGIDATSRRRYYSRQYQRTVNTSSGPEAQDAANYLLSQLKDPKQRANVIRLHPSAVVGLFPVVAQIDKNVRMRQMKRPIGAPSTQLDGFIQRISWTCTPASDFFTEYQASPADLVNYWRVAALHTTLSAQAASGQNQATINALPDRLTNSLAQSMPSSQTLWFEPGTARFEAVTVQTIPTTSPGYTTATLTMAANLTFTHPAGSVVCEPLQTGVTDPTTWDASSLLGASYAPILSGGTAGTNTVTVGPLPDAAYDAFGQTWNTGDVIQLSPSGVLGIPESATIQSVSTTYPGYTQATITFTANLIHTHPVGDYVSDIFAAAGTDPTTFAPTTRVTY